MQSLSPEITPNFAKRAIWLGLSCSGSTASFLLWSGSALAQVQPLPTDLEGYQRFWIQQTPAQRVEMSRRGQADPNALTATTSPSFPNFSAPPAPTESPVVRSALTRPRKASTQAAALQGSTERPWIQSDSMLDVLAPALINPRVAQLDPVDEASQSTPDSYIAKLNDLFPQFRPDPSGIASAADPTGAQLNSSTSRFKTTFAGYAPSLLALFPVLTQTGSEPDSVALAPELLEKFPLLLSDRLASDPTPGFSPQATTSSSPTINPAVIYAPELLAKFPLFLDSGAGTDPAALANKGSQIRQQLDANVQTQIPLDPDQLNISGDKLSYINDQQVGVAEGNARIQLSDGTTITGDKLLFYRRERRLRSEGPFMMVQSNSRQSTGPRVVKGRDLDLDLPSRSAQFQSSIVETPGEAPGTKLYIRSEEVTAIVGDKIFFENATITTSPEPPISHYVKADRVEIYPDEQVLAYDARVFAGGVQDEQGDIKAGTQIGFFPIFIYSLKDYQWILPGQSQAEGIYVKSSWAYRFDQYNMGGLRLDALQNKGLGVGFVHDYILPLTDSSNYGRANFYLVTETDQQRLSSRFRLQHFYDFYAANLLGNDGAIRGKLDFNVDNTYIPSGGRNDIAQFLFNSTFQADLSTTTLNISRTGSNERGTYSLPVTLNHSQQFGDARWLQTNLRVDYNQNLNFLGAQDTANARLTWDVNAKPPGWGGNYQLSYRTYSSSNGDLEFRRNLELLFNADPITFTRGITWSNTLNLSRQQQVDPQNSLALKFFNKQEYRSNLQFDQLKAGDWLTFTPGALEYTQALYSTGDQESQVSLNPQLTFVPSNWSNIQFRYQQVFRGNNSVPFQTFSSTQQDTKQLAANFSLFTPINRTVDAPPGYLAFSDDLPGDQPIALTFIDDTPADLEAISTKNQTALQAGIRNLLRFDTNAGFNFVNQTWDTINANLRWDTNPNLFNVSLNTSYNPNTGDIAPVNLRYGGNTSTTFQAGLRSGLDTYEPGFGYAVNAIYDPKTGKIPTYGVDLDATLGTQWQNHWRVVLGLTQDGFRRIEVRRDLRDFEVRLAYDPMVQLLRLETVLVAFPSKPVGLTQNQGSFVFSTPAGTFGAGQLNP